MNFQFDYFHQYDDQLVKELRDNFAIRNRFADNINKKIF
jgi:hypothetical protein